MRFIAASLFFRTHQRVRRRARSMFLTRASSLSSVALLSLIFFLSGVFAKYIDSDVLLLCVCGYTGSRKPRLIAPTGATVTCQRRGRCSEVSTETEPVRREHERWMLLYTEARFRVRRRADELWLRCGVIFFGSRRKMGGGWWVQWIWHRSFFYEYVILYRRNLDLLNDKTYRQKAFFFR